MAMDQWSTGKESGEVRGGLQKSLIQLKMKNIYWHWDQQALMLLKDQC